MKHSEHLFYLIKSLTKAEKRSFKLYSKTGFNQTENNYTILFDAIDKMDTYDHSRLIKSVSEKINPGSISTIKVQLNNVILKSLRNQNSTSNPTSEMYVNMDYLQVLFEKGLYSQCKKLLIKTIDLAREQEDFLAIDRLSIMQYQISLKEANIEDLKHYLEVTYPEVKEARKMNNILAEFEALAIQMRLLLLEGASIGGNLSTHRFNSIIENPLMNLPIEQYPSSCQVDYHTIWGHYYYTLSDPDKMYFHRKRVLELLEGKMMEGRKWLTHVRFLLTGLSTLRMFDEFDKELEHSMSIIRSKPEINESDTFQAELNSTLYNIRFHRDLDEGNFDQISSYIDVLILHYNQPNNYVDTNLRLVFLYNLSYAYLGNGEYKKCIYWINSILTNVEMRDLREDLQSHTRIINICAHYLYGNHILIPSLIKSTKRYLQGANRYTNLLEAFLKFASKYFIDPYQTSYKTIFENEVIHWRNLCTSDASAITLDYIELTAWLESIYSGKSMETVIKRRQSMISE